jgi:hypothetical protein
VNKIKGFVIGVVLAVAVIKLYTMSIYVYEGCKWWDSLDKKDKQEVIDLINCLSKEPK